MYNNDYDSEDEFTYENWVHSESTYIGSTPKELIIEIMMYLEDDDLKPFYDAFQYDESVLSIYIDYYFWLNKLKVDLWYISDIGDLRYLCIPINGDTLMKRYKHIKRILIETYDSINDIIDKLILARKMTRNTIDVLDTVIYRTNLNLIPITYIQKNIKDLISSDYISSISSFEFEHFNGILYNRGYIIVIRTSFKKNEFKLETFDFDYTISKQISLTKMEVLHIVTLFKYFNTPHIA